MSGKTKTRIYNRLNQLLVCLHYDFFEHKNKKQKHVHTTGLTSCLYSYPRITIIMSRKAKSEMYIETDIAVAPALSPAAGIATFGL